MRRMLGLAMALVAGLAGTCLAGAMYRNDSGAVARAVRVEFSEPAEITSMWPSFPQREPQGPATVIVLSGGEVTAGAWFSFTWWPDSARVEKIEWFASTPSSARPNLGFSDPKAQPEVHGDLLNPAFFAHPAYVMQGVSERDKVSALPLHGVPELSFYPVLGEISASSLTWTFEVSHPEGIGAAIEDGTLYIWGNNPEWQGYGEVELHVRAPDGRGSWVAIPVVVFCTNRTLVNPKGKRDYFVPWSWRLDLHRIRSVQEHMSRYGKGDDSLLDRTLRFSCWQRMPHLKGAALPGWSGPPGGVLESWLLDRVDETYRELRRIGCDAVSISRSYQMEEDGAACPIVAPHTMSDEEIAYAINEAHLQGLRVMLVPDVKEAHSRHFAPPNIDGWFACYFRIVADNAGIAERTGVEYFTLANIIMPDLFIDWPLERRTSLWIDKMTDLLSGVVRPRYAGPVVHMPGFMYLSDGHLDLVPFLRQVDIVGVNSQFVHLTTSRSPSYDEIYKVLQDYAHRYYVPLHNSLNKPMFVNEGFIESYDGVLALTDASGRIPEDAVYDGDEQAIWYRAWFAVEREHMFLRGFGWVGWAYDAAMGGVGDVGWTARLKPAEREIARAYGAPDPFRTVWVDGDASDWEDATLTTSGTVKGGMPGTVRIERLSIKVDEAYVYVAIWVSSGLPPDHGFVILIDKNGDRAADVPIGTAADGGFPHWMAFMHAAPMNFDALTGILDIHADANHRFFEMRIPFSLLPRRIELAFQAVVEDRTRGRILDRTEWLVIPTLLP